MRKRTVARLKEILERTEQARLRSKREEPNASAVRGRMLRDEEALRDAISLLTEPRP